jgi:hypothetical protein
LEIAASSTLSILLSCVNLCRMPSQQEGQAPIDRELLESESTLELRNNNSYPIREKIARQFSQLRANFLRLVDEVIAASPGTGSFTFGRALGIRLGSGLSVV